MGSERTIKADEKKRKAGVHPRPAGSHPQKTGASGGAAGLPLFLKKAAAPQALEVGDTADPLEHAADRTAASVLRTPEAAPARLTSGAELPRQQTSAPAASAPPSVDEALSESGRPLDAATRAFFEPRFGRDFGDVRIHTGGRAAASAQALGALGYAHGREIVFGPGQYAPDTAPGRSLIAHELAHVTQQQPDAAGVQPVRRQVFGPAAQTGAGADFDNFMLQFQALESAAIADGYSFTDRVTAFRKVFYDSASAARTYAGAVVGGGVWNILIPGAAGTKMPPSWAQMQGSIDYLKAHQILTINGKPFDIGHTLAGADAARHPTSISVGAGMVKLRSNVEATTFIGDLGSVVTEYIHGSTASFRDTAMVRSPLLDSYYDGSHAMAGAEDMAGNADAYAMSLDSSKTLSENLRNYYAATSGGVKKRFTTFASMIGLGTLTGSSFSGDNSAWRDAIKEEVFNSALAYAAGKGWRGDVINVFNDPGPGIVTPTFWEMYSNISEWVVDIFVNRMAKEVAKE